MGCETNYVRLRHRRIAEREHYCETNDQENAITDLARELARQRGSKGTALDESRVGDSNSNGRIEQAVQEEEGMVRTPRSALEQRLGCKIPLTHIIVPRIVLAQSEKWSELLSRNGWFVPTTVWLNSLATVTVLAGSILFLLQQRKGLEDNNHKEGTAE